MGVRISLLTGDCICQKPAEDAVTCPQDCGVCGDGYCSECPYPAFPETPENCFPDCHDCDNGTCDPGESSQNCPQDCCGVCGDGICQSYEGCTENAEECPQDCDEFNCGDGSCDSDEDPLNCPVDCPKDTCGNHVCEAVNPPGPGEEPSGAGETSESCIEDCPLWPMCGDYLCQIPHETSLTCPMDCGFCGDGYCSNAPLLGHESSTCPEDCAQECRLQHYT